MYFKVFTLEISYKLGNGDFTKVNNIKAFNKNQGQLRSESSDGIISITQGIHLWTIWLKQQKID